MARIHPGWFFLFLSVGRKDGEPRHHHHHPRRRRRCRRRHRPCRRQSPATLVAIALATKAIALFIALHPCCQCHHLLHPPHPLSHTSPLSPPPSPCRPHPFCHMLQLLVDCVFFHLYCWLGGEPTGEPTCNDLMVPLSNKNVSLKIKY